jgi:hypothetical protein
MIDEDAAGAAAPLSGNAYKLPLFETLIRRRFSPH